MKLKEYLKGKSRKEFAATLNVSEGHINNLCSGTRVPSRILAQAIEKASKGKVTVLELLFPES